MSSSMNINSILSNIAKNYDASKANKNSTTSSASSSGNYDASIFQRATELVAEYKSKQESSENNSSSNSSGFIGGLSFSQIANMSTKDFLNFAYENKATSGFTEKEETETTDNKKDSSDTSDIDLPMLVRYKGEVFSTAGKSFMAVVAKIHAKYPRRSEEEIAAELMTKYGSSSTDSSSKSSSSKTTGSTLNFSA